MSKKFMASLVIAGIVGGIVGVLVLIDFNTPGNEVYLTAPAGFWSGIWHGGTMPITFIWSLFNDSVGIYEINNAGGWYDFGYLIGAGSTIGGGSSSRKSR